MKKETTTLTVLIPCLNEKKTIAEAIRKAREAGEKYLPAEYEIVVADNGSADGSLEIIKKQGIAKIIHVPVRGYGAALHWGILSAEGAYVLFADADLSYDFGEIKKFLTILPKDPDLILGSRLRGKIEKGAMPVLNRYLGTPILTFLIRLLYGIEVSDCNSGMRLVRKEFYKKLRMRNSGMEWASELLIKTALHKGKYVEVPINFYKDRRNSSPHLLPWADGWRHLKAIILLKPNSLLAPLSILFLLTIISFPFSFSFVFFFALLAENLLLSLLAAKTLHFAIEGVNGRMVKIVQKFPIVPLAVSITLFSFLQLFLISDRYLGAKLFLAAGAVIFNMWVFLIETIKTHLFNRLPDRLD